MIFNLNTEDGYYTCDKTKINYDDLDHDDNHVPLKPNSNSFGWDISVHNGKYNIGLNIEWLNNLKTIKKDTIHLYVHFVNTHKKLHLTNHKLDKKKGNLVSFDTVSINTKQTNKLSIVFESSIPININSCQIEFEDSQVESNQHNHRGGQLSITDVHTEKEFTGSYREFNIKNHVPYTDYCIIFPGGGFTISMDGEQPGITFNIRHPEDYESMIISRNEKTIINDTDTSCGVLFPLNITTKHSYKLFVKTVHSNYENVPATFYHAFCGLVEQPKWHYMTTICSAGLHTLDQISCHLHVDKHNGHLYTRVLKYGNAWDFNDKGHGIPVEKFTPFSDNNYQNSKTEFDYPTFSIKMLLGGGIHTTTPNDSYTIKRNLKQVPHVPFNFSLEKYTDFEIANNGESVLAINDAEHVIPVERIESETLENANDLILEDMDSEHEVIIENNL